MRQPASVKSTDARNHFHFNASVAPTEASKELGKNASATSTDASKLHRRAKSENLQFRTQFVRRPMGA
jgi:hypothetical protein